MPVVLCIAVGFAIARFGWVRSSAIPDLSNIVFLVLTPALLFRTMAGPRVQELDFAPVALYFASALLVFGATLLLQGWSSTGAARALAHTFGNTVMIGVPFVGLVYGESGLVALFTLISMHSLVLLTAATLVFELVQARARQGQPGAVAASRWQTLGRVVKNSILMQAVSIGENCVLDHVILDKGVVIRDGRILNGYDGFPIILKKGTTL